MRGGEFAPSFLFCDLPILEVYSVKLDIIPTTDTIEL